VFCGHSYGGTVIAGVERAVDRILCRAPAGASFCSQLPFKDGAVCPPAGKSTMAIPRRFGKNTT